jgi:hypothetical protein
MDGKIENNFCLIRIDSKVSPGVNIITTGIAVGDGTLLRTLVTSGGYANLVISDIHDSYVAAPLAVVFDSLSNISDTNEAELRRKLNLLQVVEGSVFNARTEHVKQSTVDGKVAERVVQSVGVKPTAAKSATKSAEPSNSGTASGAGTTSSAGTAGVTITAKAK